LTGQRRFYRLVTGRSLKHFPVSQMGHEAIGFGLRELVFRKI
jgi:hypothetical protein